jgi:exodeoxyribonuclease VII small subunit
VTFEADLARLERIVRELEAPELPLADAMARFEEGVAALKAAAGALTQAQGRVVELVADADGALRLEERA